MRGWGWVVAGDNTGDKGKIGKICQGSVCIIILNGDDKPETPHTYIHKIYFKSMISFYFFSHSLLNLIVFMVLRIGFCFETSPKMRLFFLLRKRTFCCDVVFVPM